VRRIERHTVRAPAEHGQSLQVPPLPEAAAILTANQDRQQTWQLQLAGNSLSSLRQELQRELIERAQKYTRSYRDLDVVQLTDREQGFDRPLILSGHQPRLFHPGVWFKNCALAELGAGGLGIPLNLVVDNDLCGLSAVPVPLAQAETANFLNCHYDQTGENVPFEVRQLLDRKLFGTFPQRLGELLAPLVAHPLAQRLWGHWSKLPKELQTRLGSGLAAARHALEAEFGWQTLELPLSELCRTRAFACFLSELLLRAGEFRELHNQSLERYRRIHGIRSKSHPVPALALEGEWCEVPFWVYSAARPKRERLFVRTVANGLELGNRSGWSARLETRRLEEQILGLLCSEICLRTRALTTTLFARLVASDLFLHGIGGAKYDELTNELARQFFRLELPEFMTLTATIRLAGHERPVTGQDVVRHQVLRRELEFHPEQHLTNSVEPTAIADKRHLIATRGTTSDLRTWQRKLEQANSELAPFIEATALQLDSEIARLQLARRRDTVLGSREISFCCFPESLGAQLSAALRNHSSASK
jgi:hypothetical protein